MRERLALAQVEVTSSTRPRGDLPCGIVVRHCAPLAAAAVSAALRPSLAQPQPRALLTRPIPSTGEALPAVGLGSWITFNVGDDPVARDACTEVMRNFVEAGGRMIDSSPMYGSSQDTIGYGLRKAALTGRVFAADKVWISSGAEGREQIERSRRKWQVNRFDLLEVHNLLDWQEHLPTLFAMKAAGQLRYVGVTTSEGRRHRDLEQIMRSQPLDFVQVTYNPVDREVEERILPLARDRGIAVIVNRPFRQGALLRALARQPLPPWSADIDCTSWAQFVLEVHRLAPRRHLRDPGDDQRRPRARERERGVRPYARRGDAPAHDRGGGARLMSEWWTYRLTSFLLFSPRTYHRLFELYNLAIWPAQLAGAAIGLAIVALLIGHRAHRDRIVAGLLAACWLWVAWAFLYQRYAQINWAATWFAAAFAFEALLLVALGVLAGRIVFAPPRGTGFWIAATLVAIAVVGYPLLAPLAGRSWTTAETFGVDPRPDRDRHRRDAGARARARPLAVADRSAALVRDRRGHAMGDGDNFRRMKARHDVRM